VRLPIDAWQAVGLRATVDRLDQGPAHALPARGLRRKQILQIAAHADLRGAAVVEEMHDAEQLAATLGHQRVDRLRFVEEALPCRLRDDVGQGRLVRAAVEGVVAIPEGFPGGKVVLVDGADQQVVGRRHGGLNGWQRSGILPAGCSTCSPLSY